LRNRHQPEDRPALPKIDWPAGTEEAEGEAAAEAGADAEADTPDLGPVSATDEPRYKLDMKPFLPLLDQLRPIDEGGDDMESGAVGMLPDVAGGEDESADVVATLEMIDDIATAFIKALAPLVGQLANGGFRAAERRTADAKLYCVGDYIDETKGFIEEIAS
jgi:hypothetical protein